MNFPQPSPEIQRILQQNYQDKQKMAEAAKIQADGNAEQIAYYLLAEAREFQANLPDAEDVAMALVNFGQFTTLLVESIGNIGYNLVRFSGKDSNGKPMELIQHVSQIDFYLTVVPKETPETPKRKIGFYPDSE